MNLLYLFLVAVVMIHGAYMDYRHRQVYEVPFLIALLLGAFLSEQKVLSAVLFIVLQLVNVDHIGPFGKGDALAMALLVAACGRSIALAAVYALVITLIFGVFKGFRSSVPMVSCLCCAYLLWLFS